ncbi:MAG: protein-tyrosine phosphatase [Thermoproteota archaeon]|jgi:protein-tyrosine phosphatase
MSNIKVLFVCLGNICRSPSAQAVFEKKSQNSNRKFFIDSAGTCAHHVGEQADSRMRQAAGLRGLDLTSISRQFVVNDFDDFDIIIGMDDSNIKNMEFLRRNSNTKLIKMTDFSSLNLNKVPDPYYGGPKGFDDVLDILDNCCENLLTQIILGKLDKHIK